MNRKKFSELRDRMSPEAQQEVKARSDEMLQAMTDTLSPQEREAAEQLLDEIWQLTTRKKAMAAVCAYASAVRRQERERLIAEVERRVNGLHGPYGDAMWHFLSWLQERASADPGEGA